jgi:hypothetical protein
VTGPEVTEPAEEPGVLRLAVDYGALPEVPVWEDHNRGKNWAATIDRPDPTQPGGYARTFWTKARGEAHFYLVPDDLLPGTAIEFGADYYTGTGEPRYNRWYGYVITATGTELALRQTDSARQAYDAGQAFLADRHDGRDTELDAVLAETLARLNSLVVEPGQRWYVVRAKVTAATRRKGRVEDVRFRLLTRMAAVTLGLTPPEGNG